MTNNKYKDGLPVELGRFLEAGTALVSDETLVDWHKKTGSRFRDVALSAVVLRIWIGISSEVNKERQPRTLAADIRDAFALAHRRWRKLDQALSKTEGLGSTADRLGDGELEIWRAADIQGDGAGVGSQTYGFQRTAFARLGETLEQGVANATKRLAEQPLNRSDDVSMRREAVSELSIIWRILTGKKKFGKEFETFCSLLLAELFGKAEAEKNLEENVKKVTTDINKHPEKYQVPWLNQVLWVSRR